jgi:hypothetical protein
VIGASAVRAVQWAIATADDVQGEVHVHSSDDGHVSIVWTCGHTRSFTPEDLEETIAHLDTMQEFPEAWFEGTDSDGESFVARLVDGELYASDTCQQADHVAWRALKKAANKALA